MKLTLPFPPSANRYWRVWRGRPVVSSEARQYKLDVATLARVAGLRPVEGSVSLTLNIYRPRKAGDLSNRIKVVEDALQGIAYENDSQVVEIIARRHDDAKNPRIEVEIARAA